MISVIPTLLFLTVALPSVAGVGFGVAIGDVTGATAQTGMMGYAKEGQNTAGLHFRQRARAFVYHNEATGKYFATVSTDTCMFFSNIKVGVLAALDKALPGVYNDENLLLSAIHNHGGPGGFARFTLYAITTLGYSAETADAIIEGTTAAVVQAHRKVVSGATMKLMTGRLHNSSISRSPTGYANDPPAERAHYDGNTDSTFATVRYDGPKGPISVASWFAVHCTSMNNTNLLITGDNKGKASMDFEKAVNGPGAMVGEGPFIASFYAANLGDVSPNTEGAFCENSGKPCDPIHSTCDGENEGCQGLGPGGHDFFESTAIIAGKQFNLAYDLWSAAPTKGIALDGDVDSRLIWVEMMNNTVPASHTSNGKVGRTCPAALGEAFAAGTTDGPGAFNFVQGNTTLNPFWTLVRNLLADPSPWQRECQAPKPVLLDLGEVKGTVAGDLGKYWCAHVLPFQIVRLSKTPPVLQCGVPGEMTTMSGRRLRARVATAYAAAHNELVAAGKASGVLTAANVTVLVTGLTNEYSHYVTTFEEYQVQRYEAASTLYGPYTLDLHLYAFTSLAEALARGDRNYPPGLSVPAPAQPDIPPTFIPPVVVDFHPPGSSFGSVHTEAPASVAAGSTVKVVFWGANPRNNLKPHPQYGYLSVNQMSSNGTAELVATDANWETKMAWDEELDLGFSLITISWDIPAGTPAGNYRITHFGYSKSITGSLSPYSGSSRIFAVTA